jgi:DNA-binding MarR family transcriptional regulator
MVGAFRERASNSAGMSRRVISLTAEMMDPMEERFPETFNRESTRIFFAIRAIAQEVNEEANSWLAPFGLNSATYNYLINLFAAKNYTLTQNEMRAFVHTTHATVAQMVRTLERDGFVKRTRNPEDGRSMMVTLTAKGIRTIKAAAPQHHAALEERLNVLTPSHRRTLMSLLMLVHEGFEIAGKTTPATPIRPRRSATA